MAHRSIHQPARQPLPTTVDDPPGFDPLAEAGPDPVRAHPPATLLGRWPALAPRLPDRPATWIAVVVALLLVAGAGWWLLRPAAPPVESTLPLASSDAAQVGGSAADSTASGSGAPSGTGAVSTSSTVPALVVQAAGAVAHPGVYRLDPAARVDDLVREAGGLTSAADRDRVNLAAPLADGERVWIPARGEERAPEVVAGGTGSGGGGAAAGSGGGSVAGAGASSATPTEPVDLNTATAEQLEALPGVGPATATAILAYREQAGGFRSVDDLLEVRGIGDAKMEQLRPLVRV